MFGFWFFFFTLFLEVRYENIFDKYTTLCYFFPNEFGWFFNVYAWMKIVLIDHLNFQNEFWNKY